MGDRLFKEYFEDTGYELNNEQSAQVNSNNHLSGETCKSIWKNFLRPNSEGCELVHFALTNTA